jgi:uncharacterized protein (DUF1499 family)
MAWLKWAVALCVVVAIAPLIVGQLGWLRGQPRAALGVTAGRLAPPSTTDNSVGSQSLAWPGHPRAERAQIAPLAAPQGADTLARLARLLADWPGAKVLASSPGYLHVGFETRWLRFVDDAEFWFDPAQGVIQVRSASRLGRRDFGVNRERIEAIRRRLATPE